MVGVAMVMWKLLLLLFLLLTLVVFLCAWFGCTIGVVHMLMLGMIHGFVTMLGYSCCAW